MQKFAGREFQLLPRCASFDGYSLHGGVQVSAKKRLVSDGEGVYRILLKTPWSGGTSSIRVCLLELMERLVAIREPIRYCRCFCEQCERSWIPIGIQERKCRAKRGAKYRKEIQPRYRRLRNKARWKTLSRKDGSKSRHVPWADFCCVWMVVSSINVRCVCGLLCCDDHDSTETGCEIDGYRMHGTTLIFG